MISLFWFFTIITIIYLIFVIFRKQDFFSINTYILLGVYLPLLISNFNWSYYHIEDRPDSFYILFIIFNLLAIFVNILPQNSIKYKNITFEIKKDLKLPVEVYNMIYIFAILMENYYVSGYFIPSRYGIDIHTARMPYVYFITTAIYLVSVMNLVEFFATKKKRYAVYILILVSFNVVTKSSRIDAFISATQLISILLFYFFYSKKSVIIKGKEIEKKSNKIKIILIAIIFAIILITIGLVVGNNRMNANGKYNLSYADGIKYTGPETPGEVLAYYYGYFPISFDNLAYNMANTEINPNYIGLSSFRTLYFGVFQFDNLLGLDGGEATKANDIRSKGAAIATGFWDFYYDFGNFIFIPVTISFAIYYLLKLKVANKKPTLLAFVLYFYWIPLWFFLSFDNRIYDYQVLLHVILMSFIIPKRYELKIET